MADTSAENYELVKVFSNGQEIKRSKRLQDKCKYIPIRIQERDINMKENCSHHKTNKLEKTKIDTKPNKNRSSNEDIKMTYTYKSIRKKSSTVNAETSILNWKCSTYVMKHNPNPSKTLHEQNRSSDVAGTEKYEAKTRKNNSKMTLTDNTVLCKEEAIDYEDLPFLCSSCDKAFKYLSALSSHSLTHTDKKPFKCERCQSTFKQKSHLTRHSFLHKKRKQFECDVCQKKFSVKYSMEVHSRTHNGEKPYSCEKCGKEFSQKSHLNTHLKSHQAKGITCDICRKPFTLTHHLKGHLKRIHNMN